MKESPLESGHEEQSDSTFVCLLSEHQQMIRNFIASLIPSVDARADIFQDVTVLLWEKRHSFEIGTNFKAWAFMITRYVIMNKQTQFKKDQRLVFQAEVIEAIADTWEESNLHPDEERLEALRSCMEHLEEDERKMLMSCYDERGAIESVAKAQGRPAATIRSILLRLRRRLERCIRVRLAKEGQTT